MSSVFSDITLEWDGVSKTIPSNAVLRVIASVEEVVTMAELSTYASRGTMPMAKMSSAYAVMLKSAGFDVTADKVYERMYQSDAATITDSITSLLMMMVPVSVRTNVVKQAANNNAEGAGAAPFALNQRTGNNLLKRHTKRRSLPLNG